VIVLDASAAVAGLLNDGPARQHLETEALHAPHLVDSEVAHTLRRGVLAGDLDPDDAWAALDVWRRLGVVRHPMVALLERTWALRDTVSAYDAAYVSLAELLDCALVTADGRLARASGVRCPVTVVPR
jgi:predicted nucleic acid-binding protein